MIVKGKLLTGPILALLGGIIMLIAAFIGYRSIAILEEDLSSYGLTWEDVGFSPFLLYVRVIFTVLWGVIGIIGALLAFQGKRIGNILAIVGGALALIGLFIPLGIINTGVPVPVFLSYSLLFIDIILMLLGGILGLILKT